MPLLFSRRWVASHPRFTRTFLLTLSFLIAFGVGFAYASWALVCRAGRCPSAAALADYEPRQTSKLYAADGRFIAELGLERRTLVKIDDIPPLVRQAFVTTEDKRFYQHSGIDWYRVPGALLADLRNRSFSEGFSTITMQLARNIFPERISREKTLVRKLKEAKVARAIELHTGKETRTLVLGHLQRGGSPTTYDRLLALRFGAAAVRAIADGAFGVMVGLNGADITRVPLADVAGRPKNVPLDSDTLRTARDLGIELGD